MYKKSGVSNQKSLTHRLVFRPDGEGVVRMNAASADSNLYSVACGTDDIYTGSHFKRAASFAHGNTQPGRCIDF